MLRRYTIKCDNCHFTTENGFHRPFYMNNDQKEYARTPLFGDTSKKIDGYEDKLCCRNCLQTVILTYRFKPYYEPKIKIIKLIKDIFYMFARMTGNGRRLKKPLPACLHCKSRDFLQKEETCPKCEKGKMEVIKEVIV